MTHSRLSPRLGHSGTVDAWRALLRQTLVPMTTAATTLSRVRPSLPSWRPAVLTMVAALGSWLCSWLLASAAGLSSDVIVLGTVLPVSLSRVVTRQAATSPAERVARLISVPVVALAASEVGVLLLHHRWLGGAVFVLVLAAAVFVRRYGPLLSALGTLVSLPFIVLLVAPVGIAPGHQHTLWPALVGLIALVWVAGTYEVGWLTGFVPRPPRAPEDAGRTPARPARGRMARALPASTRMAVQLAVGLGAAYVLGTWWFPAHWPWMLLSCYVVCSGNRGRGDVVHKGVLRLTGALTGTVGATLIAGVFATGDRWAIAILFVVLALAVWLRQASYAFWAGGVTAMLALLHGYYGEHGAEVLGERLIAVTLGAAIGVGVSWFLLPVRSQDAFRRRWADALAALAELLTALRTDPGQVAPARHRFAYAVSQVEVLEPAWRLHARVLGGHEGHPAELCRRLVACRDAFADLPPMAVDRGTQAAWARLVGATRKRMRQDDEATAPVPPAGRPDVDRVSTAIADLHRQFTRDAWHRLGGS